MKVSELLRGACVTEQFAYYELNFINEYIFTVRIRFSSGVFARKDLSLRDISFKKSKSLDSFSEIGDNDREVFIILELSYL